MMMFSANDAVYALAEAAGGYDRRSRLMNDTAREIGAHDTVVVDPSGLDDGTALERLRPGAHLPRGHAAARLPCRDEARCRLPGRQGQAGQGVEAFHIYNIDGLLGTTRARSASSPDAPTGQHTFVGAATRGGRTLVVPRWAASPARGSPPPPCSTGASPTPTRSRRWGRSSPRARPVHRCHSPRSRVCPTRPGGAGARRPPSTGTPGPVNAAAPAPGTAAPTPARSAADVLGWVTALLLVAASFVVAMRRNRHHSSSGTSPRGNEPGNLLTKN